MRLKFYRGISFRIALIFSLSTMSILMIMGLGIHHLVIQHFDRQDRAQIEDKISLINHLLQQNPHNNPELQLYLQDALAPQQDLMVQIERPSGHIIFNSDPVVLNQKALQQASDSSWLEWQRDGQSYRGLFAVQARNPAQHKPSQTIIVGINTSEDQQFLSHFRRELLWVGTLGILCLMPLGWFAAWRGLSPLKKMAKLAERITVQHLSERLDVQQIPSELQTLALAFNDMLDRLQLAVSKLSDFSSDLAHEIRTPINNLLTQTQVCLSRGRDIQDYQEVLFSNLEEFERLARMVSDMLFLAKAEHGLPLQHLQPVDLAEQVAALLDFYDALAAEKNIRLQHHGQAVVLGDAAMLRRALSNLISNAIKYGHADSQVDIHYAQHQQQVELSISNACAPIQPEQLQRLFDRFYRTDASRHRIEDGTGLGLAICKSILDAHAAQIEACYQQGRIEFRIVFAQAALMQSQPN